MFDFVFTDRKCSGGLKAIKNDDRKPEIEVPLIWSEHCVECSAPNCYKTCSRYKRRRDGNCIRVNNGITPIIVDDSLGAEVSFREWAKLEAPFVLFGFTRRQYTKLYILFTVLGRIIDKLASFFKNTTISHFLYDGWYSARQKIIKRLANSNERLQRVSLVSEVINNEGPVALHVDLKNSEKLLFRERIELPKGKTQINVSIPPYSSEKLPGFLNIHPADTDREVLLTFVNLSLVPTDITNGKKIKCVIWDLDNTLWKGVLIEDKHVTLNEDFVKVIKELDARGIVNSIASKNNKEEVEPILEKSDINDLFVFKKINWDPKSVNVSKTVREMNINPNTVVFVDDNPFERNEVSVAQPSITCIDPSELLSFIECERFNVVVSEDSKNRRNTYRMMEAMKQEEEQWEGNIDDFLKNCDIQLQIENPNDKTILRCYELLQRTNQLNSSGRRLTFEEVKEIVASPRYETFVLRSSDKFGDYGIVGFIIIEKRTDGNYITDFVISCRVANKKIEPSLINYLSLLYGGKVYFNYKKTNLNGPMFKVIEELDMKLISDKNDISIYSCSHKSDYPNIVRILPV